MDPSTSESQIHRHFSKFGRVKGSIAVDKYMYNIYFESMKAAETAYKRGLTWKMSSHETPTGFFERWIMCFRPQVTDAQVFNTPYFLKYQNKLLYVVKILSREISPT